MIDVRCMLGFHDVPDVMDTTPNIRCLRCGRFVRWWDNFRSGAIIGLAGALLILAVMALAGCACGVRNSTGGGEGPGTLAAELASLGSWSLWLGGAILGLGVVLRFGRLAALASTFAAPVLGILGVSTAAGAFISGIAGAATEVGIYAIAIGLASLWAADHIWILVVAGVTAGLASAWRHRRSIRCWLRLGTPAGAGKQVTP